LAPITIDGIKYKSAEHYYQAAKFDDSHIKNLIMNAVSPYEARKLGNHYPNLGVTDQIMLNALRAKFNQHPDLRKLLKSTGSRQLVEHTFNDAYWGDAGDGSGQNKLGKLLMQVRNELL